VVFLYLHHGKEHQIFGIRAIIGIQSGATVDKVYIQKQVANNERLDESGILVLSYVPVEKIKIDPITIKVL
jgi:hypothetical protein